MNVATLSGVDLIGRSFTYKLSQPYHAGALGRRHPYETSIFRVSSHRNYTKVSCVNNNEMLKTLGIKSHEYVLEELGYIRSVSYDWVKTLEEDALEFCIHELDLTGDDIDVFLNELEYR